MITVLIGILVIFYMARLGCSALLDVLAKTPMAGVLVILSQSDDFVGRCRGLSSLTNEERNRVVGEMSLQYYLETDTQNTPCNVMVLKTQE